MGYTKADELEFVFVEQFRTITQVDAHFGKCWFLVNACCNEAVEERTVTLQKERGKKNSDRADLEKIKQSQI